MEWRGTQCGRLLDQPIGGIEMRVLLAVLAAVAFVGTMPGCASGGRGPYKAPPGQVQKMTGYNPASGKVKGTPAAPKAPGRGKGKIKLN